MANITRKQAIEVAWRKGILQWKCHQVQKEMYDKFYQADPHSILVWLVGRQTGKSVLLAILAIEQCLRKPGSIVKLITDTKVHINTIFKPIFEERLVDCPADLKPIYLQNKYTYKFPNGSEIQLAGTDSGHYERLRGSKCDLVLVDEAGFCTNLQNIVLSVLIPTTTHTKGKLVLASTPPEEEDHDFVKFIEEAEHKNLLTIKTLDDNPLLTDDEKKKIEERMGGRHSEKFRREYLCELIKSSNVSVLPEFNADLEKELVKEWERPPFWESYVAMDLGGKDLTAVLFGYYDFRKAKLIIEDELIYDFREKDNTLKKLVGLIQEKEKDLWYDKMINEQKKPFLRVSDINHIVTQEINTESKGQLYFQPAKKDDRDSAINTLRSLLSARRVIINPKCKTLIRHLKNVRWKSLNNKTTFARSVDNGHYDAAAACIILARHVEFDRNPYPAYYGTNLDPNNMHVYKNNPFKSNPQIDAFKKIFNLKGKK